MGWLTDIFQDVPLSTELREKLATVEAESDALKTDNVILKDDLREARAQILTLEKRLEQFEVPPGEQISVEPPTPPAPTSNLPPGFRPKK